jgi:hypothetical protein
MKLIQLQLTIFIFVFIVQSFLEQSSYEFFLIFSSDLSFDVIEIFKTISWSIIYRIRLFAVPYLISIIVLFNLIKSSEIYFIIGILNILVNLIIVTYFTFLMGHLIFDKRVFYFSIFSSIVLHFLLLNLKPKYFKKIVLEY